MLIIVTCLLMENKSSCLKPTITILTFQLNFFFGSSSNGFSNNTESREYL